MSATKTQSTSGASFKTSKKHKLADNSDSSSKKRRVETAPSTVKATANADDGEQTNFHPSRKSSTVAGDNKDGVLNGQSSREAHQKQKALKQERVASKPNADSIARSKKLWEKLRIKSKIPKDERKQLVDELFEIITGRVKDFVFKHDSVRVIQCALKYATPEQKKQIAGELRGSYRELSESRYGKFLVAKLIVLDGDSRDVIIPEFYGHVKRLMRHPEASWIVDDIYRAMATPEQKAMMLREWYGPEFVLFGPNQKDKKVTSDLATLLKESPEKRGPIMQHLKEMTNQLVQKKTTGFTMLHDALLQYFINCKPDSPEHTEFLELLRDDEEGDLFKNLAFTKSGSRLVCLALAYGSSKDRRNILKHFKTHMKLLAADPHGHLVLLAAFEVIDDTVMTAKAVIPELTSKDLDSETRDQETLALATNLNARIPLLWLMSDEPPKWLIDSSEAEMIAEVRQIRETTSKKEPETRRGELNKAISEPLLAFVASQAGALVETSFGCQFIIETLLGALTDKSAAVKAIAALASADADVKQMLATPHASRMLKSLAQGGRYQAKDTTIVPSATRLGFSDELYLALRESDDLIAWTTGPNAFVIVGMLESVDFSHEDELKAVLLRARKEIQSVSPKDKAAFSGSRLVLEKIGAAEVGNVSKMAGQGKTEGTTKKSKRHVAS